MNRTRRQENMDSSPGNAAQGFRRPFDVIFSTTSQSTNRRPITKFLSNGPHRFEITRRSDRESCFDHVDTKFYQRLGDLQLFRGRHAATGRLLAIAKRRIEDDHVIGHDGFTLWGGKGGPETD